MDVLKQHEDLTSNLDRLIDVGGIKFSGEVNLRLERIECLLNLLGNPQNSFSVIHVGGSSGKGSTVSYITNILKSDGYKVGTFLSPFLQVINEQFLIDSRPAKTNDLLEIYYLIEPFFEQVATKTGYGKPSYFEAKFAMSLMLFKNKNIDTAVIEVGLGGTLDATNILETDVSVLVSIGLDHTEILGDTIEEIACDKVGIIKNNGIVVCGFTQKSTRRIAAKKSLEKKSNIFLINRDFGYICKEKKMSIETKKFGNFDIELSSKVAAYQAHNAACAITAYGEFTKLHNRIFSSEAAKIGLSETKMPGRFEVVQNDPLVIMDGAHNPDKLTSFFGRLGELCASPILVIALKGGRDVNNIIFPFLNKISAKHIIVTSFYTKAIWECLEPSEFLNQLKKYCDKLTKITKIDDPLDAIHFAIREASKNDVIAVTGSLFLVGDIRDNWYSKREILEYIENDCAGKRNPL